MRSTRSVSRLIYLAIGILLVSSLLLVACSNTSSPSPTTTTKPVTTTTQPVNSTTQPVTTTTAPAVTTTQASTPAAAIKKGGVLKIGTGIDAVVLGNPPSQTTVQDTVTSKTCVESLARYDDKGEMVPWLADNWKIDAQAKTITVALKKGIVFHDMTPFNAEAVKWNIDRFLAAKRAELPAGTTVSVVDDYTVRLTLPAWDNTAIVGMGYFAGPQVSPTAWQKAADNDKDRDTWVTANPVGTGPFKLDSWTKTVKQVYKKFPNYWGKDAQGNQLPYLDGIEWNFFADPTVMQAAYLNKEIDIIYILAPLNAQNLKSQNANIITLTSGNGLQMTSLWYNSANESSPFAKLEVRQAVSYAVNAKAIVDSLYYGYATVINQWAVPTSPWANKNYTGYPTDPEKAKALLAKAGYASGFTTQLLTLNDPINSTASTWCFRKLTP